MRSSIRRCSLLSRSRRPAQRSIAPFAAAVLVLAAASSACGGGGGSANVAAKSMPAGGNFTGVYFSPQYGEMNLIQNGNSVVGEYKQEMRSGKIQGEVTGDLLHFEWTERKAMVSNRAQESRGHGYFRYVVDPANNDHLIKGEWGLGDDETGGGPWNGYKAKGKEPHLSNESGSGGDSSSSESDSDLESSGSNSSGGGEESSGDDLF